MKQDKQHVVQHMWRILNGQSVLKTRASRVHRSSPIGATFESRTPHIRDSRYRDVSGCSAQQGLTSRLNPVDLER
eukprot:2455306-Amphidinium_carterae.1